MSWFESLVGALQVGFVLLFSPFLRAWYNRWGASEVDLRQAMPGDDLAPQPQSGYTHAIVIRAPVGRVWPWLVQIGQGRGGFYSYEKLENLAGCDIRNTHSILPEHQNLQVGDVIRLGPRGYPCFGVAALESQHALVLISLEPKTEQRVPFLVKPGKGYSIATWQFILEPISEQVTRLLVRQRLAYSPDMAWIWRLTEPVAFVMERKMLLTIQRLSEKNQK